MSFFYLGDKRKRKREKDLETSRIWAGAWSSGNVKRLMSQSCGFESRHCILDGHFSHIFVVKL